MPGVALPGGAAVPAFYPWIYPLDPSMVGGGVLPGAWGVVNMPGTGGASLPAGVQIPAEGTRPNSSDGAETAPQAKKRSGRKGKKEFEPSTTS
eukprot:CAMPEP_0114692168 /NCGR_PEP_ID=MMETSP0191-20121206/67657_1 /TAXON_ID=126664 /ORGANISM="Sorites sp." /LENGTH=92 /DNA_ID=CAMNT_0001984279 /DNA_START=12 /DNA_END=287 /DNA_ORIENTATION=-